MALCLKHKARHEYAQRFLAPIQDWVQLPTKVEMDAWRKENQKPFKINIVTNITVTLTKEKKYEYFGYVGMVRRKDVKN